MDLSPSRGAFRGLLAPGYFDLRFPSVQRTAASHLFRGNPAHVLNRCARTNRPTRIRRAADRPAVEPSGTPLDRGVRRTVERFRRSGRIALQRRRNAVEPARRRIVGHGRRNAVCKRAGARANPWPVPRAGRGQRVRHQRPRKPHQLHRRQRTHLSGGGRGAPRKTRRWPWKSNWFWTSSSA